VFSRLKIFQYVPREKNSRLLSRVLKEPNSTKAVINEAVPEVDLGIRVNGLVFEDSGAVTVLLPASSVTKGEDTVGHEEIGY
jgi:hypothetical protein